jgi:hypothetical protein
VRPRPSDAACTPGPGALRFARPRVSLPFYAEMVTSAQFAQICAVSSLRIKSQTHTTHTHKQMEHEPRVQRNEKED